MNKKYKFKNMKITKLFSIKMVLIFAIGACSNLKEKQQVESKPNIVYILADDLGYGDLSCYGQTHFETPNIDKLAKNGMKFTQHYSGSTVCAPSRSSLMTGQHTGHTFIRGNKEIQPEGQHPLEAEALHTG
jgi:arylsulfatase A